MRVARGGLARAVAVLGIGLLATACTVVTGGKAQAPPSAEPWSLTGQAITQVLVNDKTLSRILNQPFVIDSRLPPRFGGPEALQGLRSPSPDDCLGVAEMLHQSVYGASKVNNVAVEAWRHAARPGQLTSIKEGVVSPGHGRRRQRAVLEIRPAVAELRWSHGAIAGRRVPAQGGDHERPSCPVRSRGNRCDRVQFGTFGSDVDSSGAGHRYTGQLPGRGRGRLLQCVDPVAARIERYQRHRFRHRAPHDGKGQRAQLSTA